MIEEKPNPRELETLLQDLEDGCITPENHAQLMDLIIHDPGARTAYCDHMSFASALHTEAVARMDLLQEEITPFSSRQRRNIFRSVIAAAAAVIIIAVTLATIVAPRTKPAAILAGEDAVWNFEAGGIAENRDFLPDTRLSVGHGSVEVRFSSGTRVVLEGPMLLEIRDRRLLHITDGSAWCDVAEGDESFTVMTDRLRVVDLGTRFGVHTTPWGDEVHVESGRVRVDPRLPDITGREISTGQAIATDLLGRQRPIPFHRDSFRRDITSPREHLHWTFDGPSGLTATTATENPSLVTVHSPSPTRFTPGISGKALDLSAPNTFATTDFPGFTGGAPRTIAFWIKGSPVDPIPLEQGKTLNPPILGWGDLARGKWHLCLMPDGSAVGSVWGGSWKTSAFPKGTSVLDGRWHHLASVFTGRYESSGPPEIIHYLNGEPVDLSSFQLRSPVNTSPSGTENTNLFIGYSPGIHPDHHPLPISIDELHIVRGVLRPEEIRRLAGLAP